MARAFGRKYRLTIGSPAVTFAIFYPETSIFTRQVTAQGGQNKTKSNEKGDLLIIPEGSKSLEITDLQFEANITYSTKNKGSSEQTTTIKVYNLSDRNREFIQKDGIIQLQAGYEQPVSLIENSNTLVQKEVQSFLPLIFSGQIIKAYTERRGQDLITTIVCSDSKVQKINARISKTYLPETTYEGMIEDLLDELSQKGLPVGGFFKIGSIVGQTPTDVSTVAGVTRVPESWKNASEIVLKNGYVAEGKLMDVLDEVCNHIGYRSFISLGRLYVEPKTFPQRQDIVKVSPSHVKGNVSFHSNSSGESATSQEGEDGVSLSLFLNGEITLEKLLELDHDLYKGTYTIEKVTHALDYEGGAWDTKVETKRRA